MDRCVRTMILTGALVLLCQTVRAAEPSTKPAGPQIVRLTVVPAPLPVPALKYQLMPSYIDQVPGNAEPVMYMVAQLATTRSDYSETFKKIADWLDLPADKVPAAEFAKIRKDYDNVLHYAQLAARREWCEWDVPMRTEGVQVMLPSLASHRGVARLLALCIRLDIREGRVDDAVDGLRTGLGLSYYVGKGQTLIHSLVACAMADMMLKEAEQLPARPEAPNLYWALASLPRPFVDIRRSLLTTEREWLFYEIPSLQHIEEGPLTARQVDELITRTISQVQMTYGEDETTLTQKQNWKDRDAANAAVGRALPEARAYLEKHGFGRDRLEPMPPAQIVALYSLDRYRYWRDEVLKYRMLPYWQASEHLQEVRKSQLAATADRTQGFPFCAFLEGFGGLVTITRLERRLAALQCIEAIRAYAAGHDGQLPAALGEVSEVPVPLDPMTGAALRYRLEGSKAILDLQEEDSASSYRGRIYELTISKQGKPR